MKTQLLELFEGMIFHFDLRCDGVLTYRSVTPMLMDGNYCHFIVEVFDQEQVLYQFTSFEDLVHKAKIFEVVKLPMINNNEREVLFHQKFDEDEFF